LDEEARRNFAVANLTARPLSGRETAGESYRKVEKGAGNLGPPIKVL
jgi:hypothetical protein